MNCFSSQGEKSEKYLLGIVSMELRFIVNWYKYKKINEGFSFVILAINIMNELKELIILVYSNI